MALRFGFYDAKYINGVYDRNYNAEDFSSFLDGIISDGVLKAYGDAFKVSILSGEQRLIRIGTGKGWFNGTWTVLDEPLEMGLGETPRDRLEAVILRIDKSTRTNDITTKYFGNKITLENDPTNGIFEYCLAGIRIKDGAITRANTHIGEGTDPVTPWSICVCEGGSGGGGGTGTLNDSGAYTTDIKFTDAGFELTYKNSTGLSFVNNYKTTIQNGKITRITNETAGRSINITYG